MVYRKGSNTFTVRPNGSQVTDATISYPNVTSATDVIVTQAAAQPLTGKTLLEVDNLQLNGNTISSTDTNGRIILSPNGTGVVQSTKRIQVDSGGISLTGAGAFKVIQVDPAATSSTTVYIPDGTGNLVIENATQTLTGKTISGLANTLTNVSLTSAVTGILPGANGGTGVNSTATFPSSGTVAVLTDISASQLSGIVPGSKGGTGVNNAGTLTYGTNNITFATTAETVLTLPSSGTLVTRSATETLLNKSISSTGALTGALKLPVGDNTTQRPTGTPGELKGMIRYNDTDDVFEGYNEAAGWSSIGGGGTTDRITQASHGFVVGDVLYLNGATYTKAVATAANTAEVVGMVSRVIDSSTFELTLSGEVSGLTGLTAGEVYFLSAATAGATTITEPSTIGQVSVPVGVASSTTTMYVAPKRGVVVGGVNARTQVSLTSGAVTNIQNMAGYDAGELTGWVFISSAAPVRFYVSIKVAKSGPGSDYNLSYQTSGDTPPSGFLIDITTTGMVRVTLPAASGTTSAINFALNAPAIGASFPLTVNASQVQGRTSGTPNTSYIGEKITWTTAPTSQVFSTTEADWTNASITLSAGTWLVTANVSCKAQSAAAASSFGAIFVKITDSANAVVQNQDKTMHILSESTQTSVVGSLPFNFVANVSTNTTYKIRARSNIAATDTKLFNESTAYSEFFAIRIA